MASIPEITNYGYLSFKYNTYDKDKNIFYDANHNPIINTSIYATKECCKANAGFPTIYSIMENNKIKNTGYVCCKTSDTIGNCGCNVACKWSPIFQPILLPLNTVEQDNYMEFIKEDGSLGVVTPDGSHCLIGQANFTVPTPNTLDPYTGEKGYGCKLTQNGLEDLKKGEYSEMAIFLKQKRDGNVGCCSTLKIRNITR
jgi:hypothetical protein